MKHRYVIFKPNSQLKKLNVRVLYIIKLFANLLYHLNNFLMSDYAYQRVRENSQLNRETKKAKNKLNKDAMKLYNA